LTKTIHTPKVSITTLKRQRRHQAGFGMKDTDVIKITRQTYDQAARDYATMVDELISDSWIGEFEKRCLDKFLLMTGAPGSRVLEIGCGNGKDTRYMGQKGALVAGIDISAGMLAEARKQLPESAFCQMDMRYPGFSSGVFNGVWANGCIYHVPKLDFLQVLKEIRRVLVPSGVFSFNFKVGTGENLEATPRSFKGGPRFYAYYTIKEMKNLLKQADFQVIETKQYPRKIFNQRNVHIWARKF